MVADAEDMDCGFGHRSISFLAGAIEVLPAVALFHDGLEVFLPDDAILHGIFDDGADHAAGQIRGAQRAIAEMRGEAEALVDARRSLRRC